MAKKRIEELKKNISVPIKYTSESFADERFVKVKILVMHDGLNLNGSNFTMDAIERAKSTLQNIPILAYVKKSDGIEGEDFGGHESELVLTADGGIKERYLGRPIGVVPSENNYHYEIYEDKTFVAVDGYVWVDYANEALDILQRDGSKGQSMEIYVEDAIWDDHNEFYDITDYKYTGVTLLGDGVQPAMTGAKVELISSNFSFDDSYYTMVNELKAKLQEFSETNHTDEVTDSNEETESNENDSFDTTEDNTVEPDNDALATENNDTEDTFEDSSNVETVEETEVVENEESQEDTSFENVENPETEQVSETENVEELDFELLSKELNDARETIESLNNKIAEMSSQITQLQEDNKSLQSYKDEKEFEIVKAKENAKKEEIINEFAIGLSEEELKDIVKQAETLSVEELESTLSKLFAKKQLMQLKAFAKEQEPAVVKIDTIKKDNFKSRYCV